MLADMAAAEQELEQTFERWEYLEALKMVADRKIVDLNRDS